MGSYYSYGASRKDIIKERIDLQEDAFLRAETVRHCARGNCLWRLVKVLNKKTGAMSNYIALDLLLANKEGWGYKPMDEDSGPYYFSCPLSYIEQADPPQTEYSKEWRQKVLDYHERTKEYRGRT